MARVVMLARLVAAELASLRRPLLVHIPLMVLYPPLVRLLYGTGVASGAPLGMLFLCSWDFVRWAAADDDLTGSWYFLRALPIPAAVIVGIRYVSSLAALGLYTLVALATAFLFPYVAATVRPGAWTAVMAGGVGFSALIMASFNALYYRFGYRAVIAAMPYLLIPYALAAAVLVSPLGRSRPVLALFAGIARGVRWGVDYPSAAAVLACAAIICLVAAGWLDSAASLARKELR